MTLRVPLPLLVSLVEYSYLEVALPFPLNCLHFQLVYNHISLVYGPASLVFSSFISVLPPFLSSQPNLEFVQKMVKEYQTPCSIRTISSSEAKSFSSWWTT